MVEEIEVVPDLYPMGVIVVPHLKQMQLGKYNTNDGESLNY